MDDKPILWLICLHFVLVEQLLQATCKHVIARQLTATHKHKKNQSSNINIHVKAMKTIIC